MKQLLFTILLAICSTWAFSQESFARNHETYSVEYFAKSNEHLLQFNLNNYKIVEVEESGTKFSTIVFNNGVSTFQKGFAELPVVGATLQLNPQNDVTLKVENEDYIEVKLNYPMIPSRGTIYRNQDPTTIPFVVAPESMVDSWYPQNIIESAEPFIFRDTRGVNIYITPFQYNAVQQTLRIYKSIAVSVVDDAKSSTNPLTNAKSSIEPVMANMYSSLYINYSQEKFANQLGEHGEMLVIYTSRDASAILPYINWKREKGFKVHTQQVAVGTNVKTTIQNAYNSNNNLLYVQLVGDWADIKSDLGTGQNAPMDPMLGCVAGSDFYPELIVGRFSANTAAQVTVQVNKAISYEKNPEMSSTWYKSALGMARNEGAGSGHHGGEGDDLHMERVRNKLISYNYTTVHREYDGGSSYVTSNTTATAIQNRINAGVSVINFANHGSETGWSVGNYTSTNVNALTNGTKLPFIFSVACVVGKFHRTQGDCFAETWLKKENGGAVVTIMSTINQPWLPPMNGQDYFNDILIGGYNYTTSPGGTSSSTNTTAADKRTTFGSITSNGTVLMLADQYTNTDTRETFQTWTIFGDASLQVRTNTPKALTVNAGNITGSPYSVTVTSNGTAVANARVTLFQNGVSHTAVTNSSGVASVSHNLTSGSATLTVTGYNLGTYQVSKSVGGTVAVPTTPTGLSTSGITSSGATLNWSATSGATSYDVQVRPQGGSWTIHNTSNTNFALSGLNATTTYEWQVRAKNSAGNSAYSSILSFTTPQATISYCSSQGNNSSYEWIAKVVVGTFTNSSAAAGYTDFTSKVISMEAGKAYTLSLTPGFSGTTYNEYWKIWVDLNGNGTFDSNELLFDPGSMSKTTVTGTITVPAGTSPRTTRMRVSMKYNAAQTACEAFAYGEVEDYTVQIVAAQANPPATPTGLSSSSITTSSATVSWNASANATSYDLQVRPQGGSWTTYSVTTTSRNLTSLSTATTYEYQVRAKNANGNSAYSAISSFTTQSTVISYCASKGNNANYEWIQRVQLAEMNNVSGKNSGYANFTNLTATVARGETLPIYFQVGFSGSSYTEFWSVWIDFNKNGTFDTNERLVNGSSSSNALLSANITIPADAPLGTTRMRVSMKYNAVQTACETFAYGEVEDYTINVVQSRGSENNTESFAEGLDNIPVDPYVIYPNPTTDWLNVKLMGISGEMSLRIYDIQGRLVMQTLLNSIESKVDVSNLAKGVYIISVDEEKMPINKRFVKM